MKFGHLVVRTIEQSPVNYNITQSVGLSIGKNTYLKNSVI